MNCYQSNYQQTFIISTFLCCYTFAQTMYFLFLMHGNWNIASELEISYTPLPPYHQVM